MNPSFPLLQLGLILLMPWFFNVSHDAIENDDGVLNYQIPYDLSTYQEVLSLPGPLMEISGLTYDPNRKSLVAVNDEQGLIFYLDPADGAIISTFDFGTSGDYEGVAWVNQKIFVAKSNGNIYSYDLVNNTPAEKIKTALKSGNDVEGLTYHVGLNGLVIACKGRAQIEKDDRTKGVKALYIYDFSTQSMNMDPIVSINDDQLEVCIREIPFFQNSSKKGQERLIKRARSFSPSGIAQHPFSRDIYVLSSNGKLLVVLDKDGNLLYVNPLNDDYHRQPEGICFDDKGTLFISNEGRGLVAKIYKYTYTGR